MKENEIKEMKQIERKLTIIAKLLKEHEQSGGTKRTKEKPSDSVNADVDNKLEANNRDSQLLSKDSMSLHTFVEMTDSGVNQNDLPSPEAEDLQPETPPKSPSPEDGAVQEAPRLSPTPNKKRKTATKGSSPKSEKTSKKTKKKVRCCLNIFSFRFNHIYLKGVITTVRKRAESTARKRERAPKVGKPAVIASRTAQLSDPLRP